MRGLGAVVSGGLLLLAGACSDDNPTTTGGGGGGGGTGGTIAVTVTSGTAPAYSWSRGDVFTVSVTRTADPAVIVWGVLTTPPGDGIASPVTHGMVPSGTVQVSMAPALEMTLTAGVSYTVNVVRENPVGFGFTEFTP